MPGLSAAAKTFVALIALTTLTLVLSFFVTATLGLALAFAIAVGKALLVAYGFMHLGREPPASRFALLAGVLLAVLLVSGVVTDVAWRITPDVRVPPLP